MKYEFVAFQADMHLFMPWSFIGDNGCDYEREIRQRAKDGWRYAGWLPLEINGEGVLVSINLVFEREDD